jgi:hypothetical protein
MADGPMKATEYPTMREHSESRQHAAAMGLLDEINSAIVRSLSSWMYSSLIG